MTAILSDKSRILSTVPPALRELFPRAAVYAHLIYCSFSLYENTAQAVERDWQLSPAEIERLAIRSCPTYTGNLLASFSLQQNFSPEVLSQTPGLYCFDYVSQPCMCFEWRTECICDAKWWRIDIDPKHSERGFILPVRHPRHLFFEALRIFRHSRDSQGFLLKLRTDERRVA